MTVNAKLDTVRKLLNKAEGASTPEEAEAFGAKAADLMVKYGIEAAELAAASNTAASSTVGHVDIPLEGYENAKAHLLNSVAKGLGCEGIIIVTTVGYTDSGRRKTDKAFRVYGVPSDLEAYEMLATSLLLQATTSATQDHKRTPWVHGKTFRNSFLLGYASRVGQRMQDTRKAAVAEASSGAELVLVGNASLVKAALIQANPRTGKVSVTAGDRDSYRAGQAAGSRADLGGTRVGTGARAALR